MAGSPPVRAVLMTIEALKIPNVNYVEVYYRWLLAEDHLKEEFTKLNPQHTIPHLTDGDFNIWDSHSIITYLVNKYGKDSSLYPADPETRALIDNKLHFDSGILYPALRTNDMTIFFGPATSLTTEGIEMINSAYDFTETFLKAMQWLVGDSPTLADISCVASVSSLNELLPIDEKILDCIMVLTLYKMDASPPVRAVFMTIEALKIPNVNYVDVNLLAEDHLKEEFLKINPQHTIPHLTDGNFNIWDSHSIITYLVNKYGKDSSLYPVDPEKRALIDNKLHFDSGVLYPAVRTNDMPIFFGTATSLTPEGVDMIKSAYDFTETFLKGLQWLVGDSPTLADISCVASVSSLNELLPIDEKVYPNITKWLERCSKLDYYKRGNTPGLLEFRQFLKEFMSRKF